MGGQDDVIAVIRSVYKEAFSASAPPTSFAVPRVAATTLQSCLATCSFLVRASATEQILKEWQAGKPACGHSVYLLEQ